MVDPDHVEYSRYRVRASQAGITEVAPKPARDILNWIANGVETSAFAPAAGTARIQCIAFCGRDGKAGLVKTARWVRFRYLCAVDTKRWSCTHDSDGDSDGGHSKQ